VFFFDEAHLLFNDAPKALVEKIEQVVRLIRSKGVGVYFVTQNPLDMCRTRCSASWATACSTRCAPSRRATRKP
jgi:type IV secretory pathway VirB4 component